MNIYCHVTLSVPLKKQSEFPEKRDEIKNILEEIELQKTLQNLFKKHYPQFTFAYACLYPNWNVVQTVKRAMGTIGCLYNGVNASLQQFELKNLDMMLMGLQAEVSFFPFGKDPENAEE